MRKKNDGLRAGDTRNRRRWPGARCRLFVLFLAVMSSRGVTASPLVGDVLFAKGVTTTQSVDGTVRLLAKGSALREGDVLTTAKRSFAIVQLKDGSRMTLRPDTVFKLERFTQGKKPEQNNAVIRLFKGGLRALTGLISKRNPSGYRLNTPVATIGIRGTEFDARLCGEDCQKESATLKAGAGPRTSQVVGRVAFLKGTLSARSGTHERKVSTGGPLYEGDTLITPRGSLAVLAFRDEGRITLQGGSRFLIRQYRFAREAPEQSNVFMRLVSGGLRAITGLVGKQRRAAYRIATPVATIGIRGTGFDLLCQGDCSADKKIGALPDALRNPVAGLLGRLFRQAHAATAPAGDGLLAYVWQGAIELQTETRRVLVEQDRAVFLASRTADPVPLPLVPDFMLQNPAPRPDSVPVDMDNLFGARAQAEAEAGLYVTVYEGHVSMDKSDGTHIDLGGGEAGYSGSAPGAPLVRLELPPSFQVQDVYPRPSQLTDQSLELMNLINTEPESLESSQQGLECQVQ